MLHLAMLVCSLGIADEGFRSGLKSGETAPPLFARDITGPNMGTALCYRCKYGNDPVVCVIARGIDPSVTRLFTALDAEIATGSKLKSFFVLVTETAAKSSAELKSLAADSAIKNVPLTWLPGPLGPRGYNIAKDAEVTILTWKETKVRTNHAFKKGGFTEAGVKAVLADLPNLLGQ